MNELINDYLKDPSRGSKNAIYGGQYTKAFLKWNRKQIIEGKTTTYALKDKIYNPETKRFITLKYKKSGTKNKILTKKSLIKKNKLLHTGEYFTVRLNEYSVPDKETTLPGGETVIGANTSAWFKKLIKRFNLFNKTTRWFLKNDKTNEILVDAELPALSQTEMNKYFRDFNDFLQRHQSPESGLFYHYYVVWGNELEFDTSIEDKDEFTMYITENVEIEKNLVEQYFADGDYCLLKHIYNWICEKISNAESNSTKKKYEAKKNKFLDITLKSGKTKIGYFTKYKDGVPEKDLHQLVNDLQIHIKIQKPFNPDIYLNIKSTKKPLRTFAYTNTRLNHVELTPNTSYFNQIFTDNYKDDLEILDNFTEMNNIKKELGAGDWIGTSCKHGYKSIKTLDKIYRYDDDFDIEAKKFEQSIGCNTESNTWSFDSIKNKDLGYFIDCGTHFNGTIDFDEDLSMYDDMKTNIKKGMRHFDQTKAYANFNKTKYYSGFMSCPGEFRKVNNFDRKGFYLIDNIVITDEKFKKLNNKLNWFINYNIYTDAELNALKNYGSFNVLCGAMGNKVDFDFNDTMKNKKMVLHVINGKEIKLPYYSKWVGRCAINSHFQSFVMSGKKEYFQNIICDHTRITYNEFKGEAIIKYPKKTAKTLKHIAAQITAYQRLVMLEQLMKMDLDKIVRVCVDGVYFWDHDVDFKTKYDNDNFTVWSDKTKLSKMTLANSPTENYLSNIYENNETINKIFEINNEYDKSTSTRNIIPFPTGDTRDYHKTEAHYGAGGCGKSTKNLLDSGLIDMCYIAPSWKLARKLQEDFKNKFNKHIDVNVYHRLVNQPYSDGIRKKYKNYLLDEASQKTEEEKNQLLKLLNTANKIMFVGDFGFQLPPISKVKGQVVKEMTFENIDNIVEHTVQRRTKCEKLKHLLDQLRMLITAKANYRSCLPLLKKYLSTITKEQLIQEYKKEDMILCSQHDFKNEYTKLFDHIEKYYITENNNLYQNGMIIFEEVKDTKCEKRHAYTIHSIQGETCEHNLYIDLRKQKSLRMIYTAISRARYINQVKLI